MPLSEKGETMRDVYEVLDQKERELLNTRMDISALMRAAPLLTEPGECNDVLLTLKAKLDQATVPRQKVEFP